MSIKTAKSLGKLHRKITKTLRRCKTGITETGNIVEFRFADRPERCHECSTASDSTRVPAQCTLRWMTLYCRGSAPSAVQTNKPVDVSKSITQ